MTLITLKNSPKCNATQNYIVRYFQVFQSIFVDDYFEKGLALKFYGKIGLIFQNHTVFEEILVLDIPWTVSSINLGRKSKVSSAIS